MRARMLGLMLDLLQLLMQAHNDNQYTLAEKSGVPQPTIGRILSGKHADPRSTTVKKIASAYGLRESHLRGDEAIPAHYAWPASMKSLAARHQAEDRGFAEKMETAAIAATMSAAVKERAAGFAPTDGRESNIIAVHPEDPLPEGFVYIKESSIAFAGGNGRTPIIELIEESEPVAYSVNWFRKKRINPKDVRRYRVTDVSMVPLLFDNDTILVNHAETNIINGKVYALRYGDDLRVKELHSHLDGTLILRSINPLFKDEVVPPALVQQHISIIGRVRDKSGSGGL